MMSENVDEKLFETLESYLHGNLTEEETREFEAKLAQDDGLRSELEIMRESILAVELGAFESSISNLAEDYNRKNPTIPKNSKNNWRFLSIAAAIAVIISLFFIFDLSTPSHEKLFADHFKEDPGLPVTMGTDSSYDFSDAMVDYKAEKYEKAIAKWTILLEDNPHNDTLNYFIANSWMNTGQIEKAIPFLQLVASNSDSKFKDRAQWYLALAYVHQDNSNALSNLSIEQNDQYRERIKSLKKAYDKL